MAKKENQMHKIGGLLTLLGSLIYLYVYFTWYGSNYPAGPWLSTTSFLAPFVIGFSLFGAVTLFFMGLGTVAGKMSPDPKMAMNILWKFVMVSAVGFVIITGGTGSYWLAVIAFVLTYIGAMSSSEM